MNEWDEWKALNMGVLIFMIPMIGIVIILIILSLAGIL